MLVNRSDEEKELMIDLAPYGINASCATDFWNDQIIPLKNGILRSQLPARSCLLVIVPPVAGSHTLTTP